MTLSPKKKGDIGILCWNLLKPTRYVMPSTLSAPHLTKHILKINPIVHPNEEKFSENLCKFLSSEHMFCTRKEMKENKGAAKSYKVNKVENLLALKNSK